MLLFLLFLQLLFKVTDDDGIGGGGGGAAAAAVLDLWPVNQSLISVYLYVVFF